MAREFNPQDIANRDERESAALNLSMRTLDKLLVVMCVIRQQVPTKQKNSEGSSE
jgi:hypothetical protein